jgi:hypothetical protein
LSDESGLFNAPAEGLAKTTGDRSGIPGVSVEKRLDDFAEAAKEATQLAGKLRLGLNRLSENARSGNVGTARGQLGKLSESLAALTANVEGLAEHVEGLRTGTPGVAAFVEELRAALIEKNIEVTKGPEPYWLAYPAWFTVEQDSKGLIAVTLNGERLDSARPTAVAAAIAAVVNEKFQWKPFAELLISVRQLLRRAGAAGASLRLDDVYEVFAMEPGRKSARSKELSRAAFYFAVHRLSEELARNPGPALRFPPSDRSEFIFFTKDRESRRYLTVEFGGSAGS